MRPPRQPYRVAAILAVLVLSAGVLTGCGSGRAAPPAVPTAPAPLTPSATTVLSTDLASGDHNISFTVDGTTTYGTLHIPAHAPGSRLPAALLLPGSGPTDRDGNQPRLSPGTLAELARLMGDDGIATLRYDKYGTGLTGLGAYTDKAATLDLGAYVRQAEAAYRFLASRSTTDPHRLLLAGHDEGAVIALEAVRTARPAPAGLALLQPQDERLLDLVTLRLDRQLDTDVAAGRIDADQAAAVKESIAQGVADLRAGGTADTTDMPAQTAAVFEDFNSSAAYVRTADAVHPPDPAGQVPAGARAMVTCGTADADLPCSTTGPLVAALAAAGTTGPGLVTLPDVDHLLRPARAQAGTTALAPAAQRAVHDFDTLWSGRGA
ncbi:MULTISPECIES: alpha/beta hydrolase [Kitasatospora]